MEENNPSVFISYCQESVEFTDKVLEFSNRLRSEGIDTNLDQYIESPIEGWPRWMENSIREADYIIIVCTQEYLNRLMGKVAQGTGRGVKWESNIIYQYLYNNETLNERFVPIILEDSDKNFIPVPLQSATYYDVSKNERYDDLYWRLRGVNKREKPRLGKLRPLSTKERKSLFVSTPIDIETWDKAIWRGAAFLLDPQNTAPPCFLLPFVKEKYAVKIFKDWIALFGEEDKYEELRIAIVEGEIPGEEKGYTVHITPNYDHVAIRMEEAGMKFDESLVLSISRMQRAIPKDNFKMLNMFKSHYKIQKKYFLLPAILDEENNMIKPIFELGIIKKEIIFRHVDEINEGDIDIAVKSNNKPWKEYKS